MALTMKKPTPSKGKDKDKAADGVKVSKAKTQKLSKKAKAELDRPFVATLPRVNLLSPDVQEVVEQARLKRLFLVLGVAVLGLLAFAWIAQAGLLAVAQNRLDDENAKKAELGQQLNALAPVQIFYGGIESNRFTIQSTMAKEVLTSKIVGNLNAVTPGGMSLSNVSITVVSAPTADAAAAATPAPAGGGACPSQDPYTNPTSSAGCVTVDGNASSRQVLSQWLDALDKSDLFTVAFIPSTTSDTEGGGVTFSATIGIDGKAAYQNRYADPEFLKAGSN